MENIHYSRYGNKLQKIQKRVSGTHQSLSFEQSNTRGVNTVRHWPVVRGRDDDWYN